MNPVTNIQINDRLFIAKEDAHFKTPFHKVRW